MGIVEEGGSNERHIPPTGALLREDEMQGIIICLQRGHWSGVYGLKQVLFITDTHA